MNANAPSESAAGENASDHQRMRLIGIACGVLSALLYTSTNICLRYLTGSDPVWVSTVKALPTLVIAIPLVLVLVGRSQPILTSWRDTGRLITTGVLVQLFGNVGFQWSLGILGLSISIPLIMGTMLVGGAVTGRIVLGESVGRQRLVAILLLTIASGFLAWGAQQAKGGAESGLEAASPWIVSLAVLASIASGASYALLGTMMRKSMQLGTPLVSTLCVLSGTGFLFLTSWTYLRIGMETVMETPGRDFLLMLLSGIFNAAAFFAMAKALKQIPVLFVQILNASQTAIAAVVGFVLFAEALTPTISAGIALTVIGLVCAGLRRRK